LAIGNCTLTMISVGSSAVSNMPWKKSDALRSRVPPLPASVVDATSKRYLEAYRRVTGADLKIA